MSWVTEWSTLSNRIQGLIDAAHFLFLTIRDPKTENLAVFMHILQPHSKEIHKAIQSYWNTYRSTISSAGIGSIQRFNETWNSLLRDSGWNKLNDVQSAITLLSSFKSEFTFHLSDAQAISRRVTERAFVHLQRSIVADSTIREKWKRAYFSGETDCEKLGANHLLSHGIWAFKTSSEGERTDLILGSPITEMAEVEATGSTLVLTEWKLVKNPKTELATKADQALKQAKRYSAGILAGFELGAYRYLTIVSKNTLELPPDVVENDISYHFINIAVDPLPPSKG